MFWRADHRSDLRLAAHEMLRLYCLVCKAEREKTQDEENYNSRKERGGESTIRVWMEGGYSAAPSSSERFLSPSDVFFPVCEHALPRVCLCVCAVCMYFVSLPL